MREQYIFKIVFPGRQFGLLRCNNFGIGWRSVRMCKVKSLEAYYVMHDGTTVKESYDYLNEKLKK